MPDEVKCSNCGRGPSTHAEAGNECHWGPLPTDSTPSVIEQALLLGDQLEEVERAIRHYRSVWTAQVDKPINPNSANSTRRFHLSKGFEVLSEYRETLRRQLVDLDFGPEYERLRQRQLESIRRRQQAAHDSYLEKRDS